MSLYFGTKINLTFEYLVNSQEELNNKRHYYTNEEIDKVLKSFIGDYDMCIKTDEYDLKEIDKGYKITTVYNLELDGNFISKCKVEIEISEQMCSINVQK